MRQDKSATPITLTINGTSNNINRQRPVVQIAPPSATQAGNN